MKEYSLFKYLQNFGVDKNFFDISCRTSIDFVGGELGFKSKNSGLLSKFKKQFIPLTSVFPENRKKIYISLEIFQGGEHIDMYGVGTPIQVEKNYTKAILEISNLIHKKIQKKVSSGTGYDDAFYEEAEQEYGLFHKYDKILEKNKIYSVSNTADIPEDLDYMYHTPKEREEYDGEHEFLSRIFSDFREAYFNYPYNEKDNKRLGPTHYFYLQYKKYSFFVGFDALTTENSDFIYIKI
jgi:hypothetical protein